MNITSAIAIKWIMQHPISDVNIGLGNDSVSSSNKPLPEQMLTQICVSIWCP